MFYSFAANSNICLGKQKSKVALSRLSLLRVGVVARRLRIVTCGVSCESLPFSDAKDPLRAQPCLRLCSAMEWIGEGQTECQSVELRVWGDMMFGFELQFD